MRSRKRQKRLRKMRYLEKRKQDDEIRLLRLSLINQKNAKRRSTEEIIDSIWHENCRAEREENDLVNLLVEFKHRLDRYQTDSISNRCLAKAYIFKARSRYPRKRQYSGSRYRAQNFTEISEFNRGRTRDLRIPSNNDS